ncbi:transcriptional regulator [Salmonella enterica subsp. enterica serovar Choleraesuis]|nr:transcriptional regulator [Salmonella enterica subsp. enterica serovar Choleraesuis]
MDNQYFIYDKDSFFGRGMKTLILDYLVKEELSCCCYNDFGTLMSSINSPEYNGKKRSLLFDINSLPADRFAAISQIRQISMCGDLRVVVLLRPSNIPLFFALYSLIPAASWLLKTESLCYVTPFLHELSTHTEKRNAFSHSLVSYTRSCWLSGDVHKIISSYDWWLMEEIFKGKSLTKIAYEVKSDVQRLSYHKRRLMKKLNARNNADLVQIFSGLVASVPH